MSQTGMAVGSVTSAADLGLGLAGAVETQQRAESVVGVDVGRPAVGGSDSSIELEAPAFPADRLPAEPIPQGHVPPPGRVSTPPRAVSTVSRSEKLRGSRSRPHPRGSPPSGRPRGRGALRKPPGKRGFSGLGWLTERPLIGPWGSRVAPPLGSAVPPDRTRQGPPPARTRVGRARLGSGAPDPPRVGGHPLDAGSPGRRLEPQPHHLRRERHDAVRRPRARRGPEGPTRTRGRPWISRFSDNRLRCIRGRRRPSRTGRPSSRPPGSSCSGGR